MSESEKGAREEGENPMWEVLIEREREEEDEEESEEKSESEEVDKNRLRV